MTGIGGVRANTTRQSPGVGINKSRPDVIVHVRNESNWERYAILDFAVARHHARRFVFRNAFVPTR